MGKGISQDEVTQTLLLRAVQQATGASTPSEAFAKMDDLTKDPDIMKEFLQILQQYSGGSLEMMRNLMKGAFTNLTWADVNELTAGGNFDYEKIFETVRQAEQALQQRNDPTNRYEPTAAERTVTTGEKMMSAYENRMIGIGEANIDRLGKILNALNAIYTSISDTSSSVESFYTRFMEAYKKNDGSTMQQISTVFHSFPSLLMYGFLKGSKKEEE